MIQIVSGTKTRRLTKTQANQATGGLYNVISMGSIPRNVIDAPDDGPAD
jgi:hypothetical protein